MRINGEIDAGEYIQRKEKLTEKKQRFEQLIAGNNHRFDTWLDNVEKLFSFVETARQRFEYGNLIVR